MREKVTTTCSVQIAVLFVDISFIVVNGSTLGGSELSGGRRERIGQASGGGQIGIGILSVEEA